MSKFLHGLWLICILRPNTESLLRLFEASLKFYRLKKKVAMITLHAMRKHFTVAQEQSECLMTFEAQSPFFICCTE